MKNHPMQPIERDDQGIVRFKMNRIVRRLLDCARIQGYSINEIVADLEDGDFTEDDHDQFMQLIGYSVSGFGDVAFNRRLVNRADAKVKRLLDEE